MPSVGGEWGGREIPITGARHSFQLARGADHTLTRSLWGQRPLGVRSACRLRPQWPAGGDWIAHIALSASVVITLDATQSCLASCANLVAPRENRKTRPTRRRFRRRSPRPARDAV